MEGTSERRLRLRVRLRVNPKTDLQKPGANYQPFEGSLFFDKALQLPGPAVVFQLFQGLHLNLPDPFPGDIEVLPTLFQSMVMFLSDAKSHPQDLLLPFAQ